MVSIVNSTLLLQKHFLIARNVHLLKYCLIDIEYDMRPSAQLNSIYNLSQKFE